MTYSESAQGITITFKRAVREYDDHGHIDAEQDLIDEFGYHETYDAGEVLTSLGY